MTNKTLTELRRRADAAWANLSRQIEGMDAHLDRTDAPGEWTAREVLSHLLFEAGADPATLVARFDAKNFPLLEFEAGLTHLDAARRKMTLAQFRESLDADRRRLFGYLEALPEPDLNARKARIPLFKTFLGTDEVPIGTFVGAMFDYHWNDHAGQIAKIRKAVGLPAA
jgi:DinB superfamily